MDVEIYLTRQTLAFRAGWGDAALARAQKAPVKNPFRYPSREHTEWQQGYNAHHIPLNHPGGGTLAKEAKA